METIKKELPNEDVVVMVHDGNRPLVTSEVISDSLATYARYGSAVAVIPCTEVVFESEDGKSSCVSTEREKLWRTQTPHTYKLDELLAAHKEAAERGIKSTAASCMLMKELGKTTYFSKGSEENLKITTTDGFVDILNPRACYPSSKRAAETLCAAYKKEYGVDVVIIRPGHVYGPTMTDTDNRASSQFPRDVKAGKNIIMKSAGTQLRSYCYVLDCATAILTVLLNGESGEAYNVSNKNSVVTIREMAEAFAEVGGKKLIFEEATKAESASFNLMQNSSLTSEKIEALGWSAQFDMLSGARRTLNSMF